MKTHTHIVSFVCLLSMTGGARALTPPEVFAQTSPSIWSVQAYDKDGLKLGSGSAVVIAPETLITNCHVLRKAARISISSDNISAGAVLDQWDTVRDVCQIKAKNLKAPAVKMGNSAALVVGQTVFSIGSPLGLELSLGAGLISSLRKNEQSQLEAIQTTTPISPGSSGGGLFDEQARLIGITTFQAKEGQNLNFAIPVEWIKELPSRHALARSKDESERIVQESKKVSAPPPAQKTWRYQWVSLHGKRKEITFIQRDSGNDIVSDEATVDGNPSPSMQWTPGSPILRMRSAGGIEWAEFSPKLFASGSQSQNLRGIPLLDGHFNVSIRQLGEHNLLIGGKTYPTIKVELRGMREQFPSWGFVYTFTATAWYAKDIGRVVKASYVTTPSLISTVLDKYEMTLLAPAQGEN